MKNLIYAAIIGLVSSCSVHKKVDPVPMPSCEPCVCPSPTNDPVPLPGAGCTCGLNEAAAKKRKVH